MSEPQSRLEISNGDEALLVVGEIDAHSAPQLADRLAEPGENGQDRRVDLSGVDFMDSSGLRVLIDAHSQAESAGTKLILVAPGRAVRRVIQVSGLEEHLNLDPAEV